MLNGVSMARFQIQLKQLLLNESAKRGSTISQRTLAAETGLDLMTVSRWYRNDVSRIEPTTLYKFMNYFNVGFDDLVRIIPDEGDLQRQETVQ